MRLDRQTVLIPMETRTILKLRDSLALRTQYQSQIWGVQIHPPNLGRVNLQELLSGAKLKGNP